MDAQTELTGIRVVSDRYHIGTEFMRTAVPHFKQLQTAQVVFLMSIGAKYPDVYEVLHIYYSNKTLGTEPSILLDSTRKV